MWFEYGWGRVGNESSRIECMTIKVYLNFNRALEIVFELVLVSY